MMNITKEDLLSSKCADFTQWKDWNEWLIQYINGFGFIQSFQTLLSGKTGMNG